MYILLNTSQPMIWLGWVKPKQPDQIWQARSWQASRDLSNQILRTIAADLDKWNWQWADITGIGVFAGPSQSFTGLRVGHVIANSLGYSLKIGVANSADPDQWTSECIDQLAKNRPQIIRPEYGRPPQIG